MVLSAAACQRCPSPLLSRHQPLGLSPASLPGQETGPGEAETLDHELLQPGTTAAQPLGRGVLRGQSRKWSHPSSGMRRRWEAARRNSLFGGSCLMSTQQTSWLPAAGVDLTKRHRFSPASRVGRSEEMIKWQELKIRQIMSKAKSLDKEKWGC